VTDSGQLSANAKWSYVGEESVAAYNDLPRFRLNPFGNLISGLATAVHQNSAAQLVQIGLVESGLRKRLVE
jgi:hypothetical protein